jgi:hypothetical protein
MNEDLPLENGCTGWQDSRPSPSLRVWSSNRQSHMSIYSSQRNTPAKTNHCYSLFYLYPVRKKLEMNEMTLGYLRQLGNHRASFCKTLGAKHFAQALDEAFRKFVLSTVTLESWGDSKINPFPTRPTIHSKWLSSRPARLITRSSPRTSHPPSTPVPGRCF